MAHVSPPFGLFERMLAGRYLRAKRKHGGVALISIISVTAITLAVMALIITMSVMNGFRETLLSRILGVNGHVYIDVSRMPAVQRNHVVSLAERVPGVLSATAVIDEQALASADGQSAGVYVRGISRQALQNLTMVTSSIAPPGSLQGFQGVEDPTIILGQRLARRLRVHEGSAVTLMAPQAAATPFGLSPRSKAFVIGGLFNTGSEYDAGLIFLPLEQAQILFGRGEAADRIELRIRDPDQTVPVMMQLRQMIGPDVLIYDWRAENESLVGALVVERNVMRLILMIIVAIAALNIVTGLVMLVKNKSRDIAVLRTIGATKGAVVRIFFMAGASIGVFGLGLGLLLGLGFCLNIGPIQDFIQTVTGFDLFPGDVYMLESLPARVEWSEVIMISLFTLAVNFSTTLATALWASRLEPVEALRYE